MLMMIEQILFDEEADGEEGGNGSHLLHLDASVPSPKSDHVSVRFVAGVQAELLDKSISWPSVDLQVLNRLVFEDILIDSDIVLIGRVVVSFLPSFSAAGPATLCHILTAIELRVWLLQRARVARLLLGEDRAGFVSTLRRLESLRRWVVHTDIEALRARSLLQLREFDGRSGTHLVINRLLLALKCLCLKFEVLLSLVERTELLLLLASEFARVAAFGICWGRRQLVLYLKVHSPALQVLVGDVAANDDEANDGGKPDPEGD